NESGSIERTKRGFVTSRLSGGGPAPFFRGGTMVGPDGGPLIGGGFPLAKGRSSGRSSRSGNGTALSKPMPSDGPGSAAAAKGSTRGGGPTAGSFSGSVGTRRVGSV